MRAEGLLRVLEAPFLRADRALERALPAELNPLAQTGAIANTTFLIALGSGILLLFWYVPSVHQAYGSLASLDFAGRAMRALHRYSSDACLFFVLLHALRYFFARRFAGARWLAWITGMLLTGMLWLVGWLGYWLVWDERGHAVALGTAKLLDVLPIFAEPFSRSFLTDEGVNTLLFFVVFFVHMLAPLVMAVALWLHITRLSRPRFLTGRTMTIWVSVSLVLVSVLLPADLEAPARMLVAPETTAIDAWYLAPLLLTDRLGGGALWAIVLVGGVLLYAVPWAMRRRAPVAAAVDVAKCNACQKCAADCPYGAITMVPRTDGKPFLLQAEVDPGKCLGCGICAGSCDSAGIGLPWISATEIRRRLDEWIDAQGRGGERPMLAFLCSESAAAGLHVDPSSGECAELPGYRALAIPCAGWVHPLTIERALRHGASGVLVVGCGPSECGYREGGTWTGQRLAAEREPMLRHDKVDPARVRFLQLDRTARAAFVAEAHSFREGAERRTRRRTRATAIATGLGVAAVLVAATAGASVAPYAAPPPPERELIVSFQHPGEAGEHCRRVTKAEQAQMPPHMRRDQICERGRTAVRLRVRVDERVVYQRAHAPGGLFGDNTSVAIERLRLPAGRHHVEVAIGDTAHPDEWTYRAERVVEIAARDRGRLVVLFDRSEGFRWFGAGPEAGAP